jgi:hypothetical protein
VSDVIAHVNNATTPAVIAVVAFGNVDEPMPVDGRRIGVCVVGTGAGGT